MGLGFKAFNFLRGVEVKKSLPEVLAEIAWEDATRYIYERSGAQTVIADSHWDLRRLGLLAAPKKNA